MARKRGTLTFQAELVAGHKGICAVIVPFHPEEAWEEKPVRLAGRRHGWPVTGLVEGTPFAGYVGDRWGRFFITLPPRVLAVAGRAVGETVGLVVAPDRSAAVVAEAVEQSRATTQPSRARPDAVELVRPRAPAPSPRPPRAPRRRAPAP